MADTIGTIVTRVKRRHSDMTTAMGIEYANKAHRDVLCQLPLRVDTEDIAHTLNGRSYVLDADILQIWDVLHYDSATAWHRLEPSSYVELTTHFPGHQALTPNRPSFWARWEDSSQRKNILVHPASSATPSGGYPKMVLYVTRVQVLDASSTVPEQLQNADLYETGIEYYASKDLMDLDRRMALRKLYDEEMKAERLRYARVTRNFRPSTDVDIFREPAY